MKYEYQSIFKDELYQFLDYQKARRYKNLDNLFYRLKMLDHFFIAEDLQEKAISRDLVLKWNEVRPNESLGNRHDRTVLMRTFCSWLNDLGYEAFILPNHFNKYFPKHPPHIYTKDELRRFFQAIETYPERKVCPYKRPMMRTFFFLLYTSGFRVSELCNVRLQDVKAEEGYIIIIGGKNEKDRIVPIHPEAARQLLELKEKYHLLSKQTDFFFKTSSSTTFTRRLVYDSFRNYLEEAGIPHGGRGAGPRVHDFRFTYANHLFLKWVEEGADLRAKLPYLKAMLGHKTYDETFYYLELFSQAHPVILKKVEEAFGSIIREYEDDSTLFY